MDASSATRQAAIFPFALSADPDSDMAQTRGRCVPSANMLGSAPNRLQDNAWIQRRGRREPDAIAETYCWVALPLLTVRSFIN